MTREEAKRRIECCRDFLANNYSDMGEPNITAFNMAMEALEQKPQWHDIEELPENDRLILLSFANYPVVAIGRYIGSEEEGGAFYIDSAKESLSSIGLIVNGWQELPKCRKD